VTVFAHAGHWLPQLLYLAPLIVLVTAIVVGRVRDRRERREGRQEDV
jgi:cytochrome c oxidase assembly factor CtaG